MVLTYITYSLAIYLVGRVATYMYKHGLSWWMLIIKVLIYLPGVGGGGCVILLFIGGGSNTCTHSLHPNHTGKWG